jgi:hypothetical protein
MLVVSNTTYLSARLKSLSAPGCFAPNGSWAEDRRPTRSKRSGHFAPNGSWVIHHQPLMPTNFRLAVTPPSTLGGKLAESW